jgi:hypothetical protein
MTTEGDGFSGFGYSGDQAGANGGAEDPRVEDHAEEVVAQTERNQIPGLETSTSDCFNRANQIARSLNHTNLSIDHLMLALTMDASARRLLERIADVAQVRETAMQKLGKNYTRSSRDVGEQTLPPTSDLADLGKAAREAAAEREQLIAISDLINSFPKVNGRLAYGNGEVSPTAVIESIKNGLVPKVDDAVTRIEAAVRDAIQQQSQTVTKLLEDLSAGQAERAERQREFMDDIRRQVAEAAEVKIAEALRTFNEQINAKVADLEKQPLSIDDQPRDRLVSDEPATKTKSGWNWLGLL